MTPSLSRQARLTWCSVTLTYYLTGVFTNLLLDNFCVGGMHEHRMRRHQIPHGPHGKLKINTGDFYRAEILNSIYA